MKQLKQPYKSYLTPMVHVFKNSSGRITKQVLCYGISGTILIGRADHKYDPIKCGWQHPLGFLYIGPVMCCRRCHRHIWSKEQYDKCPHCHRPLNNLRTAIHSSVSPNRVPEGGTLMSTYSQQEGGRPT